MTALLGGEQGGRPRLLDHPAPGAQGVRRFQAQARRDLEARSRAPRSCPHKSSGALAEGVRALRRPLPTFGTQRLKREWDLPRSHRALQRIPRPHGLLRPRQRRYPKQPDRAALTAPWALFPQISADTPDLDDIPHSGPQMQALHRPAVQDTARQVGSGLPFLTFASRRSAQASALFAQRLQTHLQRCGVILRDLTWQTDNGGEFIGELQPFPVPGRRHFGSQHERIPPVSA